MKDTPRLDHLIALIEAAMDEQGMRPADLARAANLKPATVSRLLNKKNVPSPDTLGAVGKALGLDAAHLMWLAGAPLPAPGPLDAEAAYIARRLSELPPGAREKAIEALGIQLDTIYELVMGEPGRRSVQVGTGDAEARLREGKKTLTDALDEVKELTLEQRALIEAFAAELGPDHPDLPHQVALLVRAVARTQESSAPTE